MLHNCKSKVHRNSTLLPCGCRESLEREMADYAAYQQAIQDTEKWILQVSFQLMAHNSLYITNRAQTQEQMSAHQALLADVRAYQVSPVITPLKKDETVFQN